MNTTTWKNRALSVVLTVIMVFSMLPLSVFAADSTPGTEDNPLLISSAEEMKAFRERVNKGESTLHARLTADIDLSGEKWTPIGQNNKQYKGTFDGNGHTISGIQFAAEIDTGLFGYVGSGGTVQDLFILANKENTLDASGILVNQNKGTIRRCSVEITAKTTVSGNGNFGIIASSNRGTIEDCYSSCVDSTGDTLIQTTARSPHIGGIAYMNNQGTIKSCFFRGYLRTEKNGSSYTPLDYAIVAYMPGTVINSYCFNPKALTWADGTRTDMVKVNYIYKDEQNGYGYGDIGVHYSDSDYRNTNPLTTQDGSLTWQLNNGDETGSTTNTGPWRLQEPVNGYDYYYPTLSKTDSRVYKNADGTFRIEPPHFHEIDGKQVEFTQVYSGEELCEINEGYVCLGSDITLNDKWQPTGKVTLCLNGHNLYTTESGSAETPSGSEQTGYGIDLKNGAELTLLDCNEKNTGWIGGSETDSAIYGVTVNKGGTLRMEGGCINRCETGVIVDGGDFTMTGGEIKGCNHVAGVEYRSGSLTLGGSAKVVDNSNSGAQNILLIRKDKKTPTIAFDDLADDAIFGICVGEYDGSQITAVTDERIPVTGENCGKYYKHLFADRFTCGGAPADYDLYLGENGVIEIGERGKHTHCICGAEHKAGDCKDVNGKTVGHQDNTETTFEEPWDPYANLDENGNPTLPTSEGSYYLTRSMTIESDGSSTWEPQGNVNLCLNGHTITYRVTKRPVDGKYEGWIRVSADSALTVTDCSEQGTVVCENHGSEDRWINAFWVHGGTLNLYGGTVKGFMEAVYVDSGTLNMYGGTLTENCSSVGGGGVYVDSDDSGNSGTFNLYGGKIIGNKATENRLDGSGTAQSYYNSRRRGGGVYVNRNAKGYCGTFNMYGGKISDNGAARGLENDEPIWRGGGVYAGGDFTMTGGTISGNTAAMFTTTKWQAYAPLGGGVYVGGNFVMTGGEITGNSLNGKTGNESFVAQGGGVYVGGKLTMTGGTISTNTVTSGVGGGVYVSGESNISNATISQNIVSFKGNYVYYKGAGGGIFANGKCDITGSKITDNRVTELKAFGVSNAPTCSGGGGIFLNNVNGGYSTIMDCTITGNTLAGATASSAQAGDRVGGGGILICQGTVSIVGSTITDNQMTTQDGTSMLGGGILCFTATNAPVIYLTGKVDVNGNTSNGNNSNLYLENSASGEEFTAIVQYGSVSGSIGVTKSGTQPIPVATANTGYTFTKEVASHFFDDSGRYVARMTEDGTRIQLISCPHDGGYENGVCKICGEGCTHPADKVNEDADETVCGICGQQMVVKVEKDGKTTYYAEKHNAYNDETLWWLFNNALESDSTVTLLADNLYAWAFVSGGKQITLDLNGKTLTETFQGITVGQGSQEDTSTNNKLTVKGTLGASEAAEADSYAFRTRSGGELNLEDFEGGGKIGGIIADGGKVTTGVSNADIKIGTLYIINGDTDISFRAGTFDKISFSGSSGSVKLGDLLAKGYAFQKDDGSYVPYDTEISQTSSLENVTVVKCDHTKLPESFSGSTCPYCGTALAATVKTKSGQISGYTEFTTALNAANAASGCTLTLLADVNGNLTVKANVTIHLSPNGHTVSGTVIVQKNASLTATGGTFSGKVNCVGTLNLTGSNLTGDLSVNGNAALTSCYVGKAVTVNKGGTLTVTGGSLTGVTVNNGGTLTFQNGNISGTAEAKSGGSVVVSGGHIDTLTGEDNAKLTLSGGNFTKITVSGNNLIDCLVNGYAFQDTNGIVDGRTQILSNVEVVAHPTHTHAWDTTAHELVCGCGDVKETDTAAPEITGIENGKTYYGNTTFTVTDKNLSTVTVDGGIVTLTNDAYTITADNGSHTIVATDLAGNSTSVNIKVYKVYNVTLVSGTGYTVTGNSTIGHGQDYEFRVDIKPGYSKTSNYKILVNGVADDAKLASLGDTDYDSCTYFGVDGNLTITVEGVADITAPEAEMTIGTNKFKSFLNRITFGLFFKETQTVTVTAGDAGSGVAKAEYLLSETAFATGKDVTGDWKSFDMTNGKGSFSIAPNAKGSVYVRVTDNAGNVTVINSEGVVVYTDSEKVTDSIEFTRLSTTDVNISVDLKGNTVKSVFCDGNELNGTSYNVLYPSADSGSTRGTIVLKNMFLSNLAAGEYTITVEYNPMGETYVEAGGNEAPDFTEVKLTVKKAERTLDFSAPDAAYDGEAYDDLRITDKPGRTTVHYKEQDADDSTYDTAAPKNAGSYTVKITVDADEDYNAKAFTKDFTISPKEVTISGVTAESKVYDGSSVATISGTAALSVNYDGENLSVQPGKASFVDKNVGENKTVNFSGFVLTGSAKDNYVLTAQPASVTADITAKEVTVTGTSVKSTKIYDGTTAAEIENIGNLIGVENGDDLTIVKGKAAYDTKNVGTAKTVSFSEFALDGADKGNYELKTQPDSVTADITPKEVTVTGATVKTSKVYDGSTAAEITDKGTLNGVEDGDDLTIVQGKAAYDTKNVGAAKTVTFSGFALDGADKGNYELKTQPASVTADITAKEVTITGTAVKSIKVYDGSTAAEIESIGNLIGVENGDELTIVKGKAAYADKNVGTAKTVTFSGFKLGGSAKDNYNLTAQPASVTADITARELTVKGLKIKTKKYDGTNAAEIDGTPTLNGVVDGDTLTLVNGTPVFDSTAVGEDIAITFTAPFALAGDEVTLKNYTLTQPTGITGNIVAWETDGSEYSVNSNDWINTDFTVTAKTGYQLSLTDAANGTWTDTLVASEETVDGKLTFYVKNTDTGVISSVVTENYRIDKTVPTGTITLNERTPFQKFLNTITFDLFFKDDVTVKLTANDEASGVKSVEYYKSDKELTLEEVKAITDWTAGNNFGITAEDMVQFVIYARITDNAGNITYLSSNGAEFDTTAPEIIGVENGKTYYVTQRVFADDVNPASVTLNGVAQDADSFFELAGDTDAVYTIVATDKAGNVTTVTVTMKPISAITDAIKDITVDNVTSADADTINQVAQQILDIAAESDEDVIGEEQWNKLLAAAENCKKLEQRIAEVSAEIDRLTGAVKPYDIAKVTSADKADIEQLIADIDALLATDNLTDAERAALEALKQTAQALLDRIADAKTAAEADEIVAVKDITKDNVTLDDKDDLQKAEKALEKALDDFDGNYTDDERKTLNDKLDTVKAALDAIGNAEKAAEEIENLPSADDVKLSDKDEIERVSKIIDALTENEKAMLGEKAIGKLKALNDKLAALAADKPTSPGTGDTNDLALWIAMLFISGGVITGVTVAGKKKKQQDR